MFRIGMKVVCVKAPTNNQTWFGRHPSVLGRVYTIREIYKSQVSGRPGLRFVEHVNPIHPIWDYECGYFADRFRPIVERKTDIGVFEEILRRESIPDECIPAEYGVDWGASA